MLSESQAPRQKRSKKSLRAMVAHVSFSPVMSFPNGGPTRVSVDFEVFGNVSGVFFTKYCKEMGEKLAIRGWVRNSRKGTIVGKIQGEKEKVDDMAMWLRLQGSPGSRIDKCIFSNWGILDTYDFQNFRVIY